MADPITWPGGQGPIPIVPAIPGTYDGPATADVNEWVEDASNSSLKSFYFKREVYGPEPETGYVDFIESSSLTTLEREYYIQEIKKPIDPEDPEDRESLISVSGTGIRDDSISTHKSGKLNYATNSRMRKKATYIEVPGASPIRVATYNVRLASLSEANPENNWVNRKDALAQSIVDSAPLIIGLQEVSFVLDSRSQGLEIVALVNAKLGLDRWAVGSIPGGSSNAIAWDKTKLDLIGPIQAMSLEYNRLNGRAGLWGIFEEKSTKIRFILMNAHWQHDDPDAVAGNKRRQESAELMGSMVDRLSRQYNLPIVLTADFNASEETVGTPRGILASYGLYSCKAVSTSIVNGGEDSYNGFDPMMVNRHLGRWIDGIYINSYITSTLTSLELKFNSGSTFPLKTPIPSDHTMIISDLKIKAPGVARNGGSHEPMSSGGGAVTYQVTLNGKEYSAVNANTAGINDSGSVYFGTMGAGSSEALKLETGKTYTISATAKIDATLPGEASASDEWGRRLIVVAGTGSTGSVRSNKFPNTPGEYRVSLKYTVPVNTGNITIRGLHGHLGGISYWTELLITDEFGGTVYWDGDSEDSGWGSLSTGIEFNRLVAGKTSIDSGLARYIADQIRIYL